MIIRNKTVSSILYAILIWCMFSFKVILIGVGESGVRADDFLILVAFLLLLAHGDLTRIRRSRAFNIYLGFVAVSLFSMLLNAALGRVNPLVSFFFVVRLLQYMVFYYLGYLMQSNGIRVTRLFAIYLGILCAAVPLQMLGIVPVPGVFTGITSRAVGNTNGPYEMAAVAAFLLCYLGYGRGSRMKGTASFALVLLSASRITFVVTSLSLAKVMLQRSRSKALILVGCASLAALVAAGFAIAPYMVDKSSDEQIGVFGRLSTATAGVSLDSLSTAYDGVPVYSSSANYFDGEFTDAGGQAMAGDGDVSGFTRVFRWATLIKSTVASLSSILIGLGPSFGSLAVDGYFVRVFAETGVLGLGMFFWFAKAMLSSRSSSWPFREYVFILLGTGCFIDIFVSYKPMLLLWLWHGMQQFDIKRKDFENRLSNEG